MYYRGEKEKREGREREGCVVVLGGGHVAILVLLLECSLH